MIHPTVEVVVATYKRPDRVERMIRSVKAQRYPASLTVVADNGDMDTAARFQNDPRINKFLLMGQQWFAFGIWNQMFAESKADIMVFVPDDVELEPDCIAAVAHAFERKFPDLDGVVGLNQQNLPTTRDTAGMAAIGRAFADRFPGREVFCPDYLNFHADAELGECAKRLGRWYWAEEVRLTHHHPDFSDAQRDEAYEQVRGQRERFQSVAQMRAQFGLIWGLNFVRVEPYREFLTVFQNGISMPQDNLKHCKNRQGVWGEVAKKARELGWDTRAGLLFAEAGVGEGKALRGLRDAFSCEGIRFSEVHGFDCFTGLPEDWRLGFPAGSFNSNGQPPGDADGVTFHIGLFQEKMPTWSLPIDFLHIDCDLYSSTRTALETLGQHLLPGSIVLFDEFHGYPGYEAHEALAWYEFVDREDVGWSIFAAGPEQIAVIITKGPNA